MNIDYLEQAKAKQPNVPLLVNIISRRVRQLNSGQRPMVKPDYPTQPAVDLALREVALGMLEAEIIYDESLDRRRTRPEITF